MVNFVKSQFAFFTFVQRFSPDSLQELAARSLLQFNRKCTDDCSSSFQNVYKFVVTSIAIGRCFHYQGRKNSVILSARVVESEVKFPTP